LKLRSGSQEMSEMNKVELRKEVEIKLNQAEELGRNSYTIAGFETVHSFAKKVSKLGYKVTPHSTVKDSYQISR
jgi:5'-3' exonuclease